MKLVVCPQRHLRSALETHQPSHVLSLVSPEADDPAVSSSFCREHMILKFNDIVEQRAGLIAPSLANVHAILALGKRWKRDAPLLIHCFAGISRSTAAAFILACQLKPDKAELHIAQMLRSASPSATPNALIVEIADGLLNRNGRMCAAITHIGRGAEAPHGSIFEIPVA
jgi:predicted protein tyrosine phosphatase